MFYAVQNGRQMFKLTTERAALPSGRFQQAMGFAIRNLLMYLVQRPNDPLQPRGLAAAHIGPGMNDDIRNVQ